MYCWEVRCDCTAVACGLNTSFCQGFLCSHRTPLSRIAIHLAQVHAAKLRSLSWTKVSSTLLWHINHIWSLQSTISIQFYSNVLMFHGLQMVQGFQISVLMNQVLGPGVLTSTTSDSSSFWVTRKREAPCSCLADHDIMIGVFVCRMFL